MPLPIAHGLLGAAAVAAINPKNFDRKTLKQCLLGGAFTLLPDFDFILVFATGNDQWHRGFTHSIAFSVFVAVLLFLYFGRERIREASAYSLAFASHFILDFTTTKIGGGLELFFPFSEKRYGLRWFGFSEFPSKMHVTDVIQAFITEFVVFGLIFLLVVAASKKLSEHRRDFR
ncbi:MAG: metal-dependent hydrolase [Pyrinomonadaceae bacterium]|nr:metal-dependent hydrolase [Pyrinomonadaceae bacterium]